MLTKLLKRYVDLKNKFSKGNSGVSKSRAKQIVDLKRIYSVSGVSSFIRTNMKYKSDPLFGLIDIQRDLNIIEGRGWVDDCDGYSIVAKRLLEEIGYKTKILTYCALKIWKSHVIAVTTITNKTAVKSIFISHVDRERAKDIINEQGDAVVVICNGIIRGPFKSTEKVIEYYEQLIDSNIIAYDIRDDIK